MTNPFSVLGVDDDASDETIRQAYLERVREYPPERDPERFEAVRAAFETIQSHKDRLRYQLFEHQPPTLDEYIESAFTGSGESLQRPGESLIQQVLAERYQRVG